MTIKRRRFGPSGYAYYIDGVKVTSVTKITGMLPSKALIDWAGNTTADYAVDNWHELGRLGPAQRINKLRRCRYEVTDPAKKRGTEVHKLAEALIAGREVTVPQELKGYVEAYTDFLNVIEPVPVATEMAVVSRKLRYGGTADLVADLPALDWDGYLIPADRWLLDIKTGEKGVWPEAALQLCGYQHADLFAADDGEEPSERPMEWLQIGRCGVVHVSSDAWELRPVDTGKETWQCFRNLLWMHKREQAMKDWIGAPASLAPAAASAARA
jgi:hypothetical protein